eukprot:3381710-Amphidinium_carterae.1
MKGAMVHAIHGFASAWTAQCSSQTCHAQAPAEKHSMLGSSPSFNPEVGGNVRAWKSSLSRHSHELPAKPHNSQSLSGEGRLDPSPSTASMRLRHS